MKFVKKITALFLALTMVMAMGITAFAADTTYTISTAADDTHTYSVYQILTGDLNDGVLSNVKAGSNYNTSKGDAAAAAEAIAALTSTGQTLANAIAEYVNMGEGTTAYGTVSATSSLTNVPAGYYLIKDNGPVAEGDSYSTYIVKVVSDVTITPKKGTVTFEKKVQDINDTTDAAAGALQDSADYDIGDHVPFTLTGTLPENYGSYTTYYYQFTDMMEKGLTFDNTSLKVYAVNGNTETEITAGYEVSTNVQVESDYNSGFTVTFADLKKATCAAEINASTKIVVKYTSTLNENAVLGSTGNVNEAKLTYSNNPNNSGEGNNDHGNTPWDAVIVFTYKVVINKVDAQSKPLTGAEFTLTKKIQDGSTKDISVVEATPGSTFTFKGLDDGTYVLKETKTPAGYNTISDITFTITAGHVTTWTTADRTSVLESLFGDKETGATYEFSMTADKSAGSLTSNVINKKGSELPSTGGMGTTVLYIAGIAMIVVAGVVVIARKRNA